MKSWNRPGLVVLAMLLLWGGSGCKRRASEESHADAGAAPADAGDGISVEGEFIRPIDTRLFWMAGKEDVENRYPSVVSILSSGQSKTGVKGRCSGVLIDPQVVLTAGHCVCHQRRLGAGDQLLIDGSSCESKVTITAVDYDASSQKTGLGVRSRIVVHEGEVRPHPELRIRLDGQNKVVSNHADLAVVVLSTPMEVENRPVQMESSEVRAGEFFVMVSYGFDEAVGGFEDRRYINRYRVVRAPEPGDARVQFEQPQRHLFKGDSGGPCFRETASGKRLIGISSRGLGSEPTFTSTYAYRGWIHAELQRIAKLEQSPILSHE